MDIAKKDFEGGDSRIVLYQPNETISIEVKLDAEYDTVWLTQAQMVELFASSKANISEHISNIFQQCELQPESTVRKFRIVRKNIFFAVMPFISKLNYWSGGLKTSFLYNMMNSD